MVFASSLISVTRRIPHEFILRMVFFIIYINDRNDGIVSKISKIVNDAKLNSNVAFDVDMQKLPRGFSSVG